MRTVYKIDYELNQMVSKTCDESMIIGEVDLIPGNIIITSHFVDSELYFSASLFEDDKCKLRVRRLTLDNGYKYLIQAPSDSIGSIYLMNPNGIFKYNLITEKEYI